MQIKSSYRKSKQNGQRAEKHDSGQGEQFCPIVPFCVESKSDIGPGPPVYQEVIFKT